MSEYKSKVYHLTADYKKSTYQTEQWNNVLSNGKRVRFEVTNYFYWGTFEIELTKVCYYSSIDYFIFSKS